MAPRLARRKDPPVSSETLWIGTGITHLGTPITVTMQQLGLQGANFLLYLILCNKAVSGSE